MQVKMTTIDDVIFDLTPFFGDFADDFDIEAIAREVAEWDDGEYKYKPIYDDKSDEYDDDAFNEVLMRHDHGE